MALNKTQEQDDEDIFKLSSKFRGTQKKKKRIFSENFAIPLAIFFFYFPLQVNQTYHFKAFIFFFFHSPQSPDHSSG